MLTAAATDLLDLEAFRTLHPWREDLRALGKPMEWLWHYDLDVDAEALWTHLIDTSRFNRAMGVAEMSLEEEGGVLRGASKVGGVQLAWIEEPWDWVAGQYLQNVRRYSRGFAHVSRVVYRLDRLEGGTLRYYVYYGWIPRSRLSRIWLRAGMPQLRRDYHRVVERLVSELRADSAAEPAVLTMPGPELAGDSRASVAAIRDALRRRLGDAPALGPLIDRLIDHVLTGDELDLYRIQVRALSRQWSVDEHDLLRLCLHATREGLLNMSWDVICPHCRGVRHEAHHLGDVPALGACEVCAIDFSTDKENAVEITFHVHPAIRAIPKRFFCSAEPATKRHIRVQLRLPAGAEREVEPGLAPGRYRLRVTGDPRHRYLEITDQSDRDRVEWRADPAAAQDDLVAAPGATIALCNDTDQPCQMILEAARWSDLALRPARLFNIQEFRDLFSQEYLAADVQLAVGEQTILFTDMVGSTRFYANRGDPDAFMEIKKHFTELYAVVGAHHGAVVKTIGDAVMGAFGSPLHALRAAQEIHQRFHQHRDDTSIRLRISLHTGPCIAVNLNSSIDYFGSTVNLAAKLQACAEAGDIAMSQAVLAAPGVRDHLDAQGAVLEDTTYHSAALGQDIPVVRWATFARPGQPAALDP